MWSVQKTADFFFKVENHVGGSFCVLGFLQPPFNSGV